jgi:hypothetical protein
MLFHFLLFALSSFVGLYLYFRHSQHTKTRLVLPLAGGATPRLLVLLFVASEIGWLLFAK